jgi:hypothetical protein
MDSPRIASLVDAALSAKSQEEGTADFRVNPSNHPYLTWFVWQKPDPSVTAGRRGHRSSVWRSERE